MAHGPYSSRSWFSDSSITHAVQSLQDEISRTADTYAADKTPAAKPDDTMCLVWTAVVFVAVLMLGLVAILAFAVPRERQLTPFGIARFVGVIVVLLGGGAFATRYYHGVKSGRRAQRQEALQQLVARGGDLRLGHYAQITGDSVGTVPWLATEIDMLVHCNLHGSYGDHFLAMLECTCVVDMTLSKFEASMGKLAAKILSHVEHEGVQRRCLDAIVFFEPLTAVPDLFLAPRDEPLHWYFEKQMQKAGGHLELLAGREYWLASSDAQACARVITPEMERLLQFHAGVTIQVFSGYCAVMFKSWSWMWPADMPHQAGQLDQNLKLACKLYDALRGDQPRTKLAAPLSTIRRDAALPGPVAVPMVLADDSGTVQPTPATTPAPRRSWHRLTGSCVGALLFGGLALALDVPHYPPEKQNATYMIGQATFPMMIGAALGLFIGHRIQRNTWRRLVAPWMGALLCGGIALAMSVPNRPAAEITFTFVLAYSLIPMILGGVVGAVVGWLIRRRKGA